MYFHISYAIEIKLHLSTCCLHEERCERHILSVANHTFQSLVSLNFVMKREVLLVTFGGKDVDKFIIIFFRMIVYIRGDNFQLL